MNPFKSLFKWLISGLLGKTSWEWLELLIVPLGLAVGAFYLDSRVEVRQERIADERVKQEILDSYLEKMQGLLLDRSLRKSSEDSEVRSVARAITTTAMKDLDAARNALLIDFLQESNLVSSGSSSEEENTKDITILSGLNLSNADLSDADLHNADLFDADLSGADLSGADLSDADLFDANLSNVYLFNADLSSADLSGADLSGADLFDADLSGAILSGVDLSGADLSGAILSGAKKLTEEQMSAAKLCKTTLPEGTTLSADRDCD